MKWYQKTWGIVLLLIFFFPVGLFLMWKYPNFSKKTKIIATALILFIAILCGGTSSGTNSKSSNVSSSKIQNLEEHYKPILESGKTYDIMTDEEGNIAVEMLSNWSRLSENFKAEYQGSKDTIETSKKDYDDKKAAEKELEKKKKNLRGLLITYSKDAVKKNLKSPKSAKFPWGVDEYSISECKPSAEGFKGYIVVGYVDATNSFNAEIRSDFEVQLDVTEDLEKYRVVNCAIQAR